MITGGSADLCVSELTVLAADKLTYRAAYTASQQQQQQLQLVITHAVVTAVLILPGYLPGTAIPGEDSGSGLGPCGCQSRNRSILSFLNTCRRRLNVSTQPASMTDWSRLFQLLITLSEKKYSRTSLLLQCLVNFSV